MQIKVFFWLEMVTDDDLMYLNKRKIINVSNSSKNNSLAGQNLEILWIVKRCK